MCAIRELGRLPYEGAIGALITYLDFKRPLQGNSEFVVVNGLDPPYPAVGSLFAIGKPAVPSLLRVVGQPDAKELVRKNAIETIMEIFRGKGPAGVRAISEAGQASQDIGESRRLLDAARDAVRFCSPSEKSACEAAIAVAR